MAEAVIVLHEAGKVGAGGELPARLLFAEVVARTRPDLAAAARSGRIGLMTPISGEVSLSGGRIIGDLLAETPAQRNEVLIAAPVCGCDEVALIRVDRLASENCQPIAADTDLVRYSVDLAQETVARAAVPGLRERLGLLRCAEMLGAADHAFAMALGYMKDRRQFGQPIGANQALRHIAADCYVQIENARVAVDLAAATLDHVGGAPGGTAPHVDADKAVVSALAYVPRAAREIVETAVHLHGGIGLTWDYGLNALLRRIVHLGMGFDPPTQWRGVLSDLYLADIQEGRA
jgi:hypothetical protein